MGPLDRPSIRRLVEHHQANNEDPWHVVAALYARLEAAPKERSCMWDDWDEDGFPQPCANFGHGENQTTSNLIVRVLLDTNLNPNLNLCSDHWKVVERRFELIAQMVATRARKIENALRDNGAAVYFMRRNDGLIKIGFSANVGKRKQQLELIHGPLEVLRVERGGRRKETVLHRRFAADRIEGEWFSPSAELLEHVESAE